ncbi:MAG: site-2 protease family protein, partial [Desulfosarcinaceae bacterium]
RQGRITLNPVPHIDLVWTIVIPIVAYLLSGGTFIIGGAKPVPVNPSNYRRPILGDICVSTAGVAVNFLIAMGMIIMLNLVHMGYNNPTVIQIAYVLERVALLNILLALFNLIPIPPLDGSHLFKYLLPRELRNGYENLGRTGAGFIILILVINIPALWRLFSTMIFSLDHFLLNRLVFF